MFLIAPLHSNLITEVCTSLETDGTALVRLLPAKGRALDQSIHEIMGERTFLLSVEQRDEVLNALRNEESLTFNRVKLVNPDDNTDRVAFFPRHAGTTAIHVKHPEGQLELAISRHLGSLLGKPEFYELCLIRESGTDHIFNAKIGIRNKKDAPDIWTLCDEFRKHAIKKSEFWVVVPTADLITALSA